MFRTRVALAFVSVLLLCSVFGCGRKPAPTSTAVPTAIPFPTGPFTNGDSSWEIRPDGTFTTSGSFGSETGTWSAAGEQVVITCQCCGNVKGTYRWAFNGGTLTLQAVDDQCFNRLNVLTSGIWSLNP